MYLLSSVRLTEGKTDYYARKRLITQVRLAPLPQRK